MPVQELDSKQPYEEFYITFMFKLWLGTASIVSATVGASDVDTETDVTSSLTDSTAQILGRAYVNVWIKGGESGKTYKITCQIEADDGSKYELDVLLPVLET